MDSKISRSIFEKSSSSAKTTHFVDIMRRYPDSHIIWAGSGFYLSVSGNHLVRFCQIETRSEIELAQTQSFRSTVPDQNQIRYRTGFHSIVLPYNARSKSDPISNWLKINRSDLLCRIKTRSETKLTQA